MVRTWKLMIALLLMSAAVRADVMDGIPELGTLQVTNWSPAQLLQTGANGTLCTISAMIGDSGSSLILPCVSPDPTPGPAPIQFDMGANTAALMAGCVGAVHSSIGQLCNVVPQMLPGMGQMASVSPILDAIVRGLPVTPQ